MANAQDYKSRRGRNSCEGRRIGAGMAKKAQSTSAELIPARPTLNALREAAKGCKACDLWLRGTQTVFGEGAAHATVMFVGEQPGDKEDLEGKPFVGPAGALLDKALLEAGIDRRLTYVTNAVKHFKWEPRGKRRIHKKPNAVEITACRAWLDAEIAVVKPKVIVCLGATAAQALLGRGFRVTQQRGQAMPFGDGRQILATVHPSSILRAPDEEARHREMQLFVADLRAVGKLAMPQNAA
jgi:DNA polymerase